MIDPRIGIVTALFTLVLASGCGEDPPGEVTGTGGDEATATSTAGPGATADADSGENACGAEDTQVAWASEGTLVFPMELGDADTLGIQVALSRTPEMGTLTMPFTTACAGPTHLWALVWDSLGGTADDNADSLYLSVDGGEEQAWLYGCRSEEGVDQQWRWLPVDAWTMTQCEHEPFTVDLAAGDHTIVVRGREGGVGGVDVAAIAAVVVSHDPQTDPSPFFPIPQE